MPSDPVLSVSKEYEDTFKLVQRIRSAAKELKSAAAKSRLLVEESHATLGGALLAHDAHPSRA